MWLDLKIMAWTVPTVMKLVWEMKIQPGKSQSETGMNAAEQR
jgi:hypothetical protein